MRVPTADHRPHTDRTVGQLLQLHVQIPPGVVLHMVHRVEAEHVGWWPVDDLADVKPHRPSLVTTTSADIT
jgi:hypothetical protein